MKEALSLKMEVLKEPFVELQLPSSSLTLETSELGGMLPMETCNPDGTMDPVVPSQVRYDWTLLAPK